MYFIYMLRCDDNSIYTGITNDLNKRMNKHFSKKGAKYTKSHAALRVEIVWKSKDKSLAAKLEYHIKRLNKKDKEGLICSGNVGHFLKNKVDSRRYRVINFEDIIDERYI